MIKSVHIKNFKNHKDNRVEFDKGLNIISGSSHNGKSALLKAIYWCLFNKPDGLGFKRKGSKGAVSVELTFDDGSIVERIRSKTINEYRLTYPDDVTKVLKALGRGTVPEEVAAITQMNEINFQTQFSEFFLLNDSGGAVAKQLNAAVGMGQIDQAIKNAASIVKKINKDAEFHKAQYIDISEQLKSIPDLTPIKQKIDEIKEFEHQEQVYQEDISSLTQFICQLVTIKEQLEAMTVPRGQKRLISKIEEMLDKYIEMSNTYDSLDELVAQAENIEEQLCSIPKMSARRLTRVERDLDEYKCMENEMRSLESIILEHERTTGSLIDVENFLSCRGLVDSIDGHVESYSSLKKQYDELDQSIDEVIEIDGAVDKIMAVIEKARKRKEELVEEAGGICPICEKPMGECGD